METIDPFNYKTVEQIQICVKINTQHVTRHVLYDNKCVNTLKKPLSTLMSPLEEHFPKEKVDN